MLMRYARKPEARDKMTLWLEKEIEGVNEGVSLA